MSKSIAIMDTPPSCRKCVFNICYYSLPLSTGRKGYACRLDESREVFDLDFYDEDYKSKKCPLKEVE